MKPFCDYSFEIKVIHCHNRVIQVILFKIRSVKENKTLPSQLHVQKVCQFGLFRKLVNQNRLLGLQLDSVGYYSMRKFSSRVEISCKFVLLNFQFLLQEMTGQR